MTESANSNQSSINPDSLPVTPVMSASADDQEPTNPVASAPTDAKQPIAPTDTKQPVAPKKPMNPKTKTAIIVSSIVGAAVIIIIILLAILIPKLIGFDYAASFAAAKTLDDAVDEFYYGDCDKVEAYADDYYISAKDFEGYVSNCKSEKTAVWNAYDELSKTSGINADSIKSEFENIQSDISSAVGELSGQDTGLAIYTAYHNFALYDLSYYGAYDMAESDITEATDYLINSGNEVLKTYGEGFAEKALAMLDAYTAYNNAFDDFDDLYDAYDVYNAAQDDLEDYIDENEPDLEEIFDLFSDSTASRLHSDVQSLRNALADAYAKNYNYGSGDCSEYENYVLCE